MLLDIQQTSRVLAVRRGPLPLNPQSHMRMKNWSGCWIPKTFFRSARSYLQSNDFGNMLFRTLYTLTVDSIYNTQSKLSNVCPTAYCSFLSKLKPQSKEWPAGLRPWLELLEICKKIFTQYTVAAKLSMKSTFGYGPDAS